MCIRIDPMVYKQGNWANIGATWANTSAMSENIVGKHCSHHFHSLHLDEHSENNSEMLDLNKEMSSFVHLSSRLSL